MNGRRLRPGPGKKISTAALRMAAALIAAALAAGCSFGERLARPEGDGGWSPERRQEEIALRARPDALPGPAGPTPSSAPAIGSGTMSLAEVLELTRHNNRSIGEAQLQLEAAAARTRDVRGRLLPSATGSGRYTWYSDKQGNQIPPALSQGQSVSIIVRDDEAGTLNGTVVMPLDITGELWEALSAAQAGYRGERARTWAVTLDRQVAAVRAYFHVLENLSLRRVTEQTIALDREQLEHADAMLESGRATRNDKLVAQVALSNSQQRLVQRNVAIRRAQWMLNDIVGRAVDAPVELVDVDQRPALPSVDDSLQASHANNPVLVSLLEEQQRLEATASSLKRSRLPRFHAGGAVDYTSSDLLQPQDIESGFVGFTWDLGTDTRREAQIAQAEADLKKSRVTLERQLREIEEAIRTTHASAAERLSALDAASTAVSQAEENLRIRQQQYQAGRAQSDDVLRASSLLAQQRAILASAIYQAHARRAELQQLMGLPIEDLLSQWR